MGTVTCHVTLSQPTVLRQGSLMPQELQGRNTNELERSYFPHTKRNPRLSNKYLYVNETLYHTETASTPTSPIKELLRRPTGYTTYPSVISFFNYLRLKIRQYFAFRFDDVVLLSRNQKCQRFVFGRADLDRRPGLLADLGARTHRLSLAEPFAVVVLALLGRHAEHLKNRMDVRFRFFKSMYNISKIITNVKSIILHHP